MARKKEISGIMVYFDKWADNIGVFTDAEIGQLFKAMLSYARFGEITDFADRAMQVKWLAIKAEVDYDKANYENKVIKRQYAAWCRDNKNAEVSFDEWYQMTSNDANDISRNQMHPYTEPETYTYSNTEPETYTYSNTNPETKSFSKTESKGGVGENKEEIDRLAQARILQERYNGRERRF